MKFLRRLTSRDWLVVLLLPLPAWWIGTYLLPASVGLALTVGVLFLCLFGLRRENMALAPQRSDALEEGARAVTDLHGLALRHAFFDAPAAKVRESMAALEARHREYTASVSSSMHAASLELAGFALALLREIEPTHIMDTGSGFTSQVLRSYAAAQSRSVEVISADDDAEWLARTRASLEKQGLSTAGLGLWKDVGAPAPPASLEFVLHDLGSMRTRIDTLPTVLALVKPGGWLILDDMHKAEYRAQALAFLASRGLLAYSVKALTGDAYGRYAYLVPVPA